MEQGLETGFQLLAEGAVPMAGPITKKKGTKIVKKKPKKATKKR